MGAAVERLDQVIGDAILTSFARDFACVGAAQRLESEIRYLLRGDETIIAPCVISAAG